MYRPHYPDELFSCLVSFTKEQEVALDCATGNGQAALPLTKFFKEVYAIDSSENGKSSRRAVSGGTSAPIMYVFLCYNLSGFYAIHF